ncbi:MAG TPA: hypothetical protein VJ890_07870 [Vineibacter sp.]|nr:hypothetical protein [Vineibacter sp.]
MTGGFFDSFLLWMVLLGGLGGAIDFLLGKQGQKRWRDRLESWWYRFDDVKWRNFGAREAQLVVDLLDRKCGQLLFSLRRTKFVAWALIAASLCGLTITALKGHLPVLLQRGRVEYHILGLAHLLVSGLMLGVSVSFTRFLSALGVRFASHSVATSLLFFVTVIVIHVIALMYWTTVTNAVAGLLTLPLTPWSWGVVINTTEEYFVQLWNMLGRVLPEVAAPMIAYLWSRWDEDFWKALGDALWPHGSDSPPLNAAWLLALLPNAARLLVALTFIASFALRPVVQAPLSLLWRRVVESDKPIATLTLGGAAATAKFVQELVKVL